jgi:hypothetical protein
MKFDLNRKSTHRYYPLGFLEKMQRINQPIWMRIFRIINFKSLKRNPGRSRILRHANLLVDLADSTQSKPPSIEVLITVHPKDNEKLVNAVASLELFSLNEISRFTLITTENNVDYLKTYFCNNTRINVLSEQKSQVWALIDIIREIGGDRFGHILQQLLKMWHCAESTSDYTLIFDSDTILNHPTLWVNSRLQSGVFPTFHSAYADRKLLELFPGFVKWNMNECYISHHVLVHRAIMIELLEELGSYDYITNSKFGHDQLVTHEILGCRLAGILNYARLGHDMSEFDTYSKYALFKYPTSVVELRWSNLTCVVEGSQGHTFDFVQNLITRDAKFIKRFRTISIHDHL